VASYLLVREARLDGSLTTSAAEAREDLNLAATITYQAAGDFVQAYEQRGTHAVLIFPGGRKVTSDDQVNPPIPAVLQGFVRRGQLGYQRMDVAGLPTWSWRAGAGVERSAVPVLPSRASSATWPSCATPWRRPGSACCWWRRWSGACSPGGRWNRSPGPARRPG
jgi:hypothetical protein